MQSEEATPIEERLMVITRSEWWRQAKAMPDRHYDTSAGISLADHLNVVLMNLRWLLTSTGRHEYFHQLQDAVKSAGLDLVDMLSLLSPVALLHDIGKIRDDKNALGKHPLTGEPVKMRHPILGVMAALELLPQSFSGRDTILALIDEHDTPYSWYIQFQKTGQVPTHKSWARLDRKIDPQEDGTGLLLLSIFKLADVDGHENLADVPWFIENANENYLREKDKPLPVPDVEMIKNLNNF